jgi:hypothetical protein
MEDVKTWQMLIFFGGHVLKKKSSPRLNTPIAAQDV